MLIWDVAIGLTLLIDSRFYLESIVGFTHFVARYDY